MPKTSVGGYLLYQTFKAEFAVNKFAKQRVKEDNQQNYNEAAYDNGCHAKVNVIVENR